jgi:hypothetical protein
VHGILLSAFTDKAKRDIALERVAQALELIRRHDPGGFRRVQRDVKRILVCWLPWAWGEFKADLALCMLNEDHVCAPETSAAGIASTVIHEATHARLSRAGVPYDEQLRPRIEHICFRAQRRFGQRLPDGADVVALAERQLGRTDDFLSDDARWRRLVDVARTRGLPSWLLSWAQRRWQARQKRRLRT